MADDLGPEKSTFLRAFAVFSRRADWEPSVHKGEICTRIREVGIVPAVRTSSTDDARFAAEAVAKSGIPIVEITMTVPGAIGVISCLVRNLHKFLPSHAVGIVSLLVLAVTIPGLYFFHLRGPWRHTYVIGAVFALYLNVFVLIAQFS